LALTLLILLCGLTILGTTADALSVYNKTHLGQDFYLPLWPPARAFDIGPTIAILVGSAVVVVATAGAIGFSRVPTLKSNPILSLLFPSLTLAASLVATAFYYTLNASSTKYTLKGWSCQWENIEMDSNPHWGKLCRESKVGIYLSVLVLPLSVCVVGITMCGVVVNRMRAVTVGGEQERKASPAMS